MMAFVCATKKHHYQERVLLERLFRSCKESWLMITYSAKVNHEINEYGMTALACASGGGTQDVVLSRGTSPSQRLLYNEWSNQSL